MSIQTAIATGLTPTTATTVDYEVTDFGTPQAAIVLVARSGSGDNPRGVAGVSIGFTDGTTDGVINSFLMDAVGTTEVRRFSAATLVRIGGGSGTVPIAGAYSAWATDGLTINYTAASALQLFVTVILIKGCDNVDVFAEQLTSTGVNNITSIGFKPNLVFFTSIGNSSVGDATQLAYSFGAAHNDASDTVTQGQIAFSAVHNSGTEDASAVTRNDSCVGQMYAGTQNWKASAEDFDSSGFSLDTGADSPGNDYVFGLALDTGDPNGVDISIVDSPTSTGTLDVNSIGLLPQLSLLGMTSCSTINTTVTADPMNMAVGIFDSTTETCTGIDVDDGAGTTDTQSNYDTKAVQVYEFGGSTHDLMHEATLSSLDSLGYNLSFPTHVDGTARKWLSISIAAENTINLAGSGSLAGSGLLAGNGGGIVG